MSSMVLQGDKSHASVVQTPQSESHEAKTSTLGELEHPPVDASALPPATLAFAQSMFDAARQGNAEHLLAAINAGLPANLTNDQGEDHYNTMHRIQ